MKVSVCIPTFNSQQYIRECIASVLAQNRTDFELIISDNCSSDDTWPVVQAFSDPRLRLARGDRNRGMAWNFNHAVSLARGEYVKILCSDDVLEPQALEKQVRFLDQHPTVALVTSARRFIDPEGGEIKLIRWLFKDSVFRGIDLNALTLLYGNVIGEPSAVLLRREALAKAGPFREGLATAIDLDLWLRVSAQGLIGYLPEPLCRIRQHPRMMTREFRKEGLVQDAVLTLMNDLLDGIAAGFLVRWISHGRVAGSFLKQALYGLRSGSWNWPLRTAGRAFRLDPGFLGLFLYLVFFRSGILGFRADQNARTRVQAGNTLGLIENAAYD